MISYETDMLLAITDTFVYIFKHVRFSRRIGAGYHSNEIKIIL